MTAHHLYLLAPGATAVEVRQFYADTLGLPEIPKPQSLAGTSVLWFDAGLLVFHIGHPSTGTVGDGHTALAVDSVEDARTRFLERGCRVDDNVIPMGYPRFYLRDPWGNQFEILPASLP